VPDRVAGFWECSLYIIFVLGQFGIASVYLLLASHAPSRKRGILVASWSMRKLALLLLTLFACVALAGRGQAQQLLPEANLSVRLPAAQWPALTREVVGDRILYYSKRQALADKANGPIIPNIAFTLEPVPTHVDLPTFSQALLEDLTNASASEPLRLMAEYRFGGADQLLPAPNMLGYKVSYLDKQSVSHIVYIVHLLHNGMGVQFIGDTTESVAGKVGPEMMQVIRSIRLIH